MGSILLWEVFFLAVDADGKTPNRTFNVIYFPGTSPKESVKNI